MGKIAILVIGGTDKDYNVLEVIHVFEISTGIKISYEINEPRQVKK